MTRKIPAKRGWARLRLVMILGLLVLTLIYAWRHRPVVAEGIAASGGEAFALELSGIPFYQQSDARWGSQTIGGSGERLASVGCTISSVSMALGHFGIEMPPDRLNQALKQRGGYTDRGWLIWDKVSEVLERRIGIEIPARPSHALIDQALRRQEPVVANVLLGGAISHWVVIIGKQDQDYLIRDPLGRKPRESLSKFGSQIYAIRILRRAGS